MIGAGVAAQPLASDTGSAPMNAKFGSDSAPPLQRGLLVCGFSVALAGCSGDLSVQSALAAPPPPATTSAPAAPRSAGAMTPTAQSESPSDAVVRALPDFSSLVDRYGPAVVNVEVVEKAQAGGPQG